MPRIFEALNDLLNNREISVEDAVTRHFTDDYRQRTDGVGSDRTGFIDHIRHLRRIIHRADIEVLHELTSGCSYADRHRVHVVKMNGDTVVQEVYLFGDIAEDGRFAEVHESTLMIEGTDQDRNLGTARADSPTANNL